MSGSMSYVIEKDWMSRAIRSSHDVRCKETEFSFKNKGDEVSKALIPYSPNYFFRDACPTTELNQRIWKKWFLPVDIHRPSPIVFSPGGSGSMSGGVADALATAKKLVDSPVEVLKISKSSFWWFKKIALLVAAATPGLSTVVFAPLSIINAARALSDKKELTDVKREVATIKSVVYGVFAIPIIGNCVAGVEICKRIEDLFKKEIYPQLTL